MPQASKAFKPDSNGNWWIEQAHFAADFAADVPPAVSHFMAISQVPISTDSFTHKVTNPAWKTKPSWYMVASADRSINPVQERMMAKRAHATTVEVNASHVVFLKPQRSRSSPARLRSNATIDSQDTIDTALVPPLKRPSDIRH
ncbi:MAG: alpha/beta fold hydrolase, partial [Xanthobacteraceae bacterium]